jgi:hypothetical protein
MNSLHRSILAASSLVLAIVSLSCGGNDEGGSSGQFTAEEQQEIIDVLLLFGGEINFLIIPDVACTDTPGRPADGIQVENCDDSGTSTATCVNNRLTMIAAQACEEDGSTTTGTLTFPDSPDLRNKTFSLTIESSRGTVTLNGSAGQSDPLTGSRSTGVTFDVNATSRTSGGVDIPIRVVDGGNLVFDFSNFSLSGNLTASIDARATTCSFQNFSPPDEAAAEAGLRAACGF